MASDPLFLGIDLGTSGARAVVIDAGGAVVASGRAALATFGDNHRSPAVWWQAVEVAVDGALAGVDRGRIVALAVDGTSGTMVAVDAGGVPLGDAIMYNDATDQSDILAAIAQLAPAESAAHGASSALARAIVLQARAPDAILHQADWIAMRFGGRRISDANNALKTGYDPVASVWPDWIGKTGMNPRLLPPVVEPGQATGVITPEAAARFGLTAHTQVVAGTTDGCASFLATGADQPGSGVTVLGTTLTLKILSERPIFAPEFGIYSHRILGMWLAGGASNSGGGAILAHVTAQEREALSPRLVPEVATGLDYYPLPKPGERFPIADPDLPSRTTPRPADPAVFLQALYEGVAAIEALGYRQLAALGSPALRDLRSVGGGAASPEWTAIRARTLGVPFLAALSDEAAYGTALLARAGAA